MAMLKCKMCGGNLEVFEDVRVVECEYCGTNQTVPDGSDEKKANLFNRANRLRMDCEFDKASGVYESIVSEYPEESEGYWGLCLCKFGIEYVDDAKTGKKIPTCHRTNATSIMDDSDFEQALENADVVAKSVYREEAKVIDRLQRQIISVVESEEPYDVFICYKETDDITKQRTEDSAIAQDIYTELVREGYKVFFSRITLRDKAGTEYEPYIYAALKSAKVMLAIGTKYEYYDAVWVKNEWSRYIAMMSDDSSKHLIPCFKNLDAYDIPKEFKNLQALDMGEMMFFKNLMDNVERFVGNTKIETVVETVVSANAGALTKRGYLFLEDRDFKSAAEYFERALDENPEDAKAYFGKVLVELRLSSVEEMNRVIVNLDTFKDFDKALRFAVGQDKVYFEKIKENADKRRQIVRLISCLKGYIRKDEKYNEAKQMMETAKTVSDYIITRSRFLLIGDYKDSAEVAEQCYEKCEELRKAEAERIAEEERKAEEERRREEKRREEETRIAEQKRSELQKVIDAFSVKNIQTYISAGDSYTLGLCSDGTVIAAGDIEGQCDVSEWEDIVAISTNGGLFSHTAGLRSDGTVVVAGAKSLGQGDVSAWSDIVAVSAGGMHTVGLHSNGTVVATGSGYDDEYDVSEWEDIVAISAGDNKTTVGLRSDGTVVAVGDNEDGQCDVFEWSDIVAIYTGGSHTVGLRSDGTVVATKYIGDQDLNCGQCDVSAWSDIVAVSAGDLHTVGLRSDGTVVAVGDNEEGQCDVSAWSDIIAIEAGGYHTVGLRSDGTVVATGDNEEGQCDVSEWSDIAVPILAETKEDLDVERKYIIAKQRMKSAETEKDLKTIAELLAGIGDYKDSEALSAQCLENVAQQHAKYRNAGLCQHCGGEFKGLFTKNCVKCGKKKDY